MSLNLKENNYLPGLNGLRFFASMFVLIGHIELMKSYLDLPSSYLLFEKINLGGIGVYFFFVLSGFLITYLLLIEKEIFGNISIRNFYYRRVLRILPLYILLVILGFFVLPYFSFFSLFPNSFNKNFSNNLFLYLLMLPNLAFSIFPPVPHIGQLWSIGVEEQFYLFWPWLIRTFKGLFKKIVFLFFAYITFKVCVLCLNSFFPNSIILKCFTKMVAMSKFECMLLGGLGAVLIINKSFYLKFFYSKFSQITAYLFFPFLSYFASYNDLLQDSVHLILSLLFLIIILNVATNPDSILKFENKVLNYLGNLSYGIYMYHMIAIFICIKIFYLPGRYFSSSNIVLYTTSCLFTILISHLSYLYFERYFLRIKSKFNKSIIRK